jgi:hypothetical protein
MYRTQNFQYVQTRCRTKLLMDPPDVHKQGATEVHKYPLRLTWKNNTGDCLMHSRKRRYGCSMVECTACVSVPDVENIQYPKLTGCSISTSAATCYCQIFNVFSFLPLFIYIKNHTTTTEARKNTKPFTVH